MAWLPIFHTRRGVMALKDENKKNVVLWKYDRGRKRESIIICVGVVFILLFVVGSSVVLANYGSRHFEHAIRHAHTHTRHNTRHDDDDDDYV